MRRFLFHAPERFWEQLHRINDRLLQTFIHLPDHRSRLIFDLDSTVVTVFGHQDGAEVGYNPRYRGKRSYNPLLCMEANSSYLWDAELRRGNAGTWDSSPELLATCFANVPADIRELRVRADAGFGLNPVFDALESHSAEYAVVARMTPSLKRSLTGLRYSSVNRDWEMAELQLRPQSWSRARRFVVARRLLSADERQPTLFALGRYAYRAWVTNLSSHPSRRLAFLRCARGHRTSHRRAAGRLCATQNSHPLLPRQCLFLEIIRLAYNLVTAFQRLCLQESWQHLTLSKLRYKLFLLPGELTRPQNRPVLRLHESSMLQVLADDILRSIHKLRPLNL